MADMPNYLSEVLENIEKITVDSRCNNVQVGMLWKNITEIMANKKIPQNYYNHIEYRRICSLTFFVTNFMCSHWKQK